MGLIFGLLAWVMAFLIVFVFPEANLLLLIIALVAEAAGFVGIMNWRDKFDEAKEWMESKTLVSALMGLIPFAILTIAAIVGYALPAVLVQVLTALIAMAGMGVVLGAVDAKTKKLNKG